MHATSFTAALALLVFYVFKLSYATTNTFVNPPAGTGWTFDGHHPVYKVGSYVKLVWTTNYKSITLILWQNHTLDHYNVLSGVPAVTEYIWRVSVPSSVFDIEETNLFYFQVWNADLSAAEFFQCQGFTILTHYDDPDISSSTMHLPPPLPSSRSRKTERPTETPETSKTLSTIKTRHSAGIPRPPEANHTAKDDGDQGGLSQGGGIGLVVGVLGGCLLFGILVWGCGHYVREFKCLRRFREDFHEKHQNSNG